MCRPVVYNQLEHVGVHENQGPEYRAPKKDPNKVPLLSETPVCTMVPTCTMHLIRRERAHGDSASFVDGPVTEIEV